MSSLVVQLRFSMKPLRPLYGTIQQVLAAMALQNSKRYLPVVLSYEPGSKLFI